MNRINSNGYIPSPVNTSDVHLDARLMALAEQLAKNTHDVWAAGKMAAGYVYAAETSDEAKVHKDLMPYEDLPEEVKDYDRKTCIETLKLLSALGWTLTPPEGK